jgi:hypothetical protein
MFAPSANLAPAASGPRHQRVDGRARLVFGRRGVRDLLQVAPARLMFPHERDGDYPLVVTIATSGGLTGGDRLAFDIDIESGASATIVSQAAEKLYRALPDEEPTRIETRLRLGSASSCEWLAQEAILFDRSRVRRSLEIDLDAGDGDAHAWSRRDGRALFRGPDPRQLAHPPRPSPDLGGYAPVRGRFRSRAT